MQKVAQLIDYEDSCITKRKVPLFHCLDKFRTTKIMTFYPSKLYLIHMLQYLVLTEPYEQVTYIWNKSSSSTSFTPRRKEWKQTRAHKGHPGTPIRSMPVLPLNLLRSGFHHVPSHCSLAAHAKYFFTLRTKLSFFTLLPCPLAVTKVTLMYIPGNRRTFFFNYYVPELHSLLNITVAELLLPYTLLSLTQCWCVHSTLINWFCSYQVWS